MEVTLSRAFCRILMEGDSLDLLNGTTSVSSTASYWSPILADLQNFGSPCPFLSWYYVSCSFNVVADRLAHFANSLSAEFGWSGAPPDFLIPFLLADVHQ